MSLWRVEKQQCKQHGTDGVLNKWVDTQKIYGVLSIISRYYSWSPHFGYTFIDERW